MIDGENMGDKAELSESEVYETKTIEAVDIVKLQASSSQRSTLTFEQAVNLVHKVTDPYPEADLKFDTRRDMSKPKKPVEVVVFNNPWKGKDRNSSGDNQKGTAKTSSAGPSNARPQFDQKKAKYEIRKLGIHGMDKKNKQNAMADLLIELGAAVGSLFVFHFFFFDVLSQAISPVSLIHVYYVTWSR
ncbi:hypothetical protein ElyMa_002983800 [Elysia marginata]|uniref:Uncharacterized protein n=1 Tax=Elysia marginata TaxID=1093978 RepID=A0AAV4IDG6_9GAST|nr:hypothetical protein ElyMa_002983800 [Elysia marginata]